MQSIRRVVRIGLVAALGVAGVVAPVSVQAQGSSVTDRGLTPPVGAQGSIDIATDGPPASAQPRLEAALRGRARAATPTTITVEIEGLESEVPAAVAAAGGVLGRGGGGLYLATLSSSRLDALANAHGITQVRRPVELSSAHVNLPPTERGPVTGTNATEIPDWTAHGYKGAGSKVGILGLFDATVLATEIASGELPAVPTGNRYCVSSGATCPFGTPGATFGNSLAEIVADGAPDVQLYLAEFGARGDYYNVIDWMAAHGVQIVVNPITWTYDGPGNGTGPSAAIVNYAVSKGIAWFNTAGEMSQAGGYTRFAGTYYRSYWNDANNNRWMNFNGNDETLTVYCGMLLGLRWSDWGTTRTDYDLYASDYNAANGISSNTRVLVSGANQALAGAQPLEAVNGVRPCNTNPANGPVYDTNKDGFVSLWVRYEPTRSSFNAPTYDIIELGTYYGWLEYHSNGGGAGIAFADSANAGMLTVGGDNMISSDLPSSSVGPLNDGRPKPDLVSSMCMSTSLDGPANYCVSSGYFGSDAAAAVVAGWAAVARPVIGLSTPAQIARYMRDQGNNESREPAVPTPMFGYGFATLPTRVPPVFPATHFRAVGPQRLIETRGAPYGPWGVPTARRLKAGETIHYKASANIYTDTAAVLNITAVNVSRPGFVAAYPSGWAAPGQISSLNVDAVGQTRSNVVVVPIGDQGYIDFHVSAEMDLVVDVIGVFTSSNNYSGNLVSVDPTRLVNSRTCLGLPACGGQPLPAATWTNVPIRGFSDPGNPLSVVPDDASAVALSITVDSPNLRGFMAAVPGNSSATTSSNLNFEAGQSATALAFVKIDGLANGNVRIFINRSAHLQVEIVGWFTGSLGVEDPSGLFVPLSPTRLLDSREPTGSPPRTPGEVITVGTAAAGVPANAMAAFVNNVAVQAAGPGELQVAATSQPQPPAFRNLAIGAANQTRATSTITKLSNGQFTMTGTMTSHYTSDLAGYFQAIADTPLLAGQTSVAGGFWLSPNYDTVVSNDGRWMFGSSSPSASGMALWDRTQDGIVNVNLGSTGSGAGFTDDSSTLLYSAFRAGGGFNMQVWTLDLSTFAAQPVSVDNSGEVGVGGNSGFVSSSADGSRVVFWSYAPLVATDTVPGSLDYYLRDLSSQVTTILPFPQGTLHAIDLSADGSTIWWAHSAQLSTTITIHRYDVATGTDTISPAAPSVDSSLSFTADGASVLLQTRVDCCSWTFSVMDTASGATTPLTLPAAIGRPLINGGTVMSGDGSVIAVLTELGLFLIGPDGSALEHVDRTWSGYRANHPAGSFAMSRNGEHIVFLSGATNLLVTPTDGTPKAYTYDRHPT